MIRKTLTFLLLCSPSLMMNADKLSYKEQQRIMSDLLAYEGPQTFLLCYVQSGSTWLRYCIEWITQRPSSPYPVGLMAEFPIDLQKPPIHRSHHNRGITHFLEQKNSRHPNKLILLLRNPHENFGRDKGWKVVLRPSYNPHVDLIRSYFDNIEFFDAWPATMRLLIYYEDFINHPRETLTRVLTFLQEPLTRLDAFMDAYQEHKKKCLEIYKTTFSHGDDLLFHSKKHSLEERLLLDAWIQETYPNTWKTYLHDRYAAQ